MRSLIATQWFLLAAYLWMIPWKGFALWKSAQRKEKYWFIFILVVNTFAVVEILYIFVFSKETTSEKINAFFKRLFKRS